MLRWSSEADLVDVKVKEINHSHRVCLPNKRRVGMLSTVVVIFETEHGRARD
jgi:hypothetical protein